MLIYNMHDIIKFYFNRGFQASDTLVLMEVSMGKMSLLYSCYIMLLFYILSTIT